RPALRRSGPGGLRGVGGEARHHRGDPPGVVYVLFVCTLNKARSIAAERLYRRCPGMQVRSAGTSERAAHQVTESDLVWADRVVVFEAEHDRWIRATFTGDLPDIVDVGIPDDFAAADSALRAELIEALSPVLGPPQGA
ncbi:MAG: hypothetical protein L6R48_19215, partial [Planctomycetes bacterium]|nr:hypothetical protein [Planctomycetota bacterium]